MEILKFLGIGMLIAIFELFLLFLDSKFDDYGDRNTISYKVNGIVIAILIACLL